MERLQQPVERKHVDPDRVGIKPAELFDFVGGQGDGAHAALNIVAGQARLYHFQTAVRGRPKTEQMCFMDFLGAMTGNQIGYGHSNEYYRKNPENHTSEMFANYGALINSPGGPIYRKMLHSIAPETCKGFDTIIEKLAKGGA